MREKKTSTSVIEIQNENWREPGVTTHFSDIIKFQVGKNSIVMNCLKSVLEILLIIYL